MINLTKLNTFDLSLVEIYLLKYLIIIFFRNMSLFLQCWWVFSFPSPSHYCHMSSLVGGGWVLKEIWSTSLNNPFFLSLPLSIQIKFHIKEICNIPLKFKLFKCKIDHISCKFHRKTDGLYRGLQEAEKKICPW